MGRPTGSTISEDQLNQLNEIDDLVRKQLAVLELKLVWGEIAFRERGTLSVEERDLIERLDQMAQDVRLPAFPLTEQQMIGIMTGKIAPSSVVRESLPNQLDLLEAVGQDIMSGSLPSEDKLRLFQLVEKLNRPPEK